MEDAKSASVLLAGDVVYSPELTKAFFEILDKIMAFGSKKVMYFLKGSKQYALARKR